MWTVQGLTQTCLPLTAENMECNNCLPECYKYSYKRDENNDHVDSKTLGFTPVGLLYLYGNNAVTIGFKCEYIRRA